MNRTETAAWFLTGLLATLAVGIPVLDWLLR